MPGRFPSNRSGGWGATMLITRLIPLALTLAGRVMASHHGHHPGGSLLVDPDLAAVMSSAAVWGRYRELLEREHKRPRTIRNYRMTLWPFWGFLADECGKTWDQARPADLERFVGRPASSGRRRGQPLSANSRHVTTSRVRHFYGVCADQGWLPRDPMRGVVVPKGGQPRARALDGDQLRTALLAAEHDPRLYLLIWFGYGAGLRVSEIAALRIEDIDLGRAADIRRRRRRRRRGRPWVADPGQPGAIYVQDGKGGRQRTIPLHPEVRAALVRWMAHEGLAGAGWLFPSPVRVSEPLKGATVGRLIGDHLHALGIDRTAHGLRHSFTSGLLEAAGEEHMLTIARIAGWSSPDLLVKVYGLAYKGRPVIDKLPDPRQDGQGGS
jgi:integrase